MDSKYSLRNTIEKGDLSNLGISLGKPLEEPVVRRWQGGVLVGGSGDEELSLD